MKRTPLAIIFLIVFVDLLGFGIVIPILPSYAQRGFGANDLMVGLIVASFSAMQFIFTPIWGRISDKIGRKPVLIIGLISSIVGYILFGLVNSLTLLFISRLLAGIGGANISAAQAYIADVTPPDQRAKGMGLIGAAFGLGFVFGPLIGGLLSSYGYHVPGFLAAGLSALSLLLTIFILPEPERTHDTQGVRQRSIFSIRDVKYLLRHPKIGKLILLYFLITFAGANLYATFPLYGAKDFHLTDREVGYLFGCIGLMGAIMQGGVIRHLVKRIDERKLFLAGNITAMIGMLLMAFAPLTSLLYITAMIYSMGIGTNMPINLSLISQHTKPSEQGSVLGINQSLSSLARVFGPINGGFVFQHLGHKWPFISAAVAMIFVTYLSTQLFRSPHPKSS